MDLSLISNFASVSKTSAKAALASGLLLALTSAALGQTAPEPVEIASSSTEKRTFFENLQFSAAVDLIHPIFLEAGHADENVFSIRSAEFTFYGPIDHVFDGVLNFSGHTDHGEFEFDVHEAHVGSSKLIPRSRFKAGKFLLGVGRLNPFHQHDWPFISAPKIQREFFNPGREPMTAESAIDTGIEATYLLPTEQFIDLTVGVTNGTCLGHCETPESKPQVPLHYLRSSTFFTFDRGAGLLLGANYLSRTSASGVKTTLLGLDTTYKKRTGRLLDWLFQAEAWYRTMDDPVLSGTSMIGAYFYSQKSLAEQWLIGLRLDGLTRLNRTFESTGADRGNFDYALVPTLTYKSSEFATLRFAYTHEVETLEGAGDEGEKRFELQFIYLLGAHPAHDF